MTNRRKIIGIVLLALIVLAVAGLNAWIFHRTVHRRVAEWDRDRVAPRAARAAGLASLICWMIIVVSGRMIAYDWFDCDLQPQSAIVNWAAGCVVERR